VVDERQYFESIGDILAAAHGEAMRAVPLGGSDDRIDVTFVDLLTAIILDRDILRALVDGGRPPQVGALRERRRPTRPKASFASDASQHYRYEVRLVPGQHREMVLAPALRVALDASRARFAGVDRIDGAMFIDIAFPGGAARAAWVRGFESMIGTPSTMPVATRWPILLDLLERCTASGDDARRALEDLQVTAEEIRNTIVSLGIRTP
jgi:hypothetical protein